MKRGRTGERERERRGGKVSYERGLRDEEGRVSERAKGEKEREINDASAMGPKEREKDHE